MPRSASSEIADRIRRILEGRTVPMWARLRVYRRGPDGKPDGGELQPELMGGLYDPLIAEYVPGAAPEPGQVVEISCHSGQLEILKYQGQKLRVLILGGPGSGKTELLVRKLLVRALENPNDCTGVVGATHPRTKLMWDMLLGLLRQFGWLRDQSEADGDMEMANGHRFVFRTGQAPSKSTGTSIQGQTWGACGIDESQNVPERAQNDIDERGRSAGAAYTVFETATLVDEIPAFIRRLNEYETHPDRHIIKLDPLQNPWTPLEHWDRLRRKYTARQWARRIESDYKLAPERLVYGAFLFGGYDAPGNIRPRPRHDDDEYTDVTAEKGLRFDSASKFIIGHDFGVRTSASEILKAYRHVATGETHWWVVGEMTTGEYAGTEGHARRLAKAYPVDDVVVSADPHLNTKDTDKSDYAIFRRYGFNIHRANAGKIPVRHRVAMLNALFCDSQGVRRLFIDCDERRQPCAPRLVESLLTMEYDEFGNAEAVRKDHTDPTHWPAGLGYGLFPWERIRAPVDPGPGDTLDPLMTSAEERLLRRGY